jgi:hypothetical protein
VNNEEAKTILRAELDKYRDHTYEQLREMVGAEKLVLRVSGASGAEYKIDIYASWDAKPNDEIRVFGCVDDGGWRAFLPLGDSFLKGPDD